MRTFLTQRYALIALMILCIMLVGVIVGGWFGRHHVPWEKCLPTETGNLSRPEFRPIRRQLAGAFANSQPYRAELRKQHQYLQELLRAESPDPAELKDALNQMHVMEGEIRSRIYAGLADTLSRMPPEHRLLVIRQLKIAPHAPGGYRFHRHGGHWGHGRHLWRPDSPLPPPPPQD